MVKTRKSNKDKRPGIPDLPGNRRVKLDGSGPTRKRTAAKKTSRKAEEVKKYLAIGAAAQLEMEMEMEDAQQEKQAQRPPAPNFKKVSKKSGAHRAVSSQSQPKTSCQAEASPDTGMDSDCADQNHTNDNKYSPPAKVSKAEKLRRDINTAKFELGQKHSLSKQHAYSDNEGPSNKKFKPDVNTTASQPARSGLCDGWRDLVALHVPNSSRPPNSAPASSQWVTKPTPQNGIQFGGFEDEQELEHSEAPQLDPHFKSSTHVNENALDDMLTPLSMVSVSKEPLDDANGTDDSSSDEEDAADKNRMPLAEIDDVKVEHTFKKRSPVQEVDKNIGEAPAVNTGNAKSKHELKNSQKKRNFKLLEEDEVSAVEVDESQSTCDPRQWMPVYEGDSDVPAINFAKRKSSSTLKGNKLSKDEVGDTRPGKDRFKKDNGPQMEPDDGFDEDDAELMCLPDKVTLSHKNTRLQPPPKTFSAEERYRNIDDSGQESDDSLDDRKLTSRPMKVKLSLTKSLIRPYLHLYKIDPLATIEELLVQAPGTSLR
ncbi:uncharacterized protein F5147DRAFT_658368 [Suillus discolor]|uniref:Uncharacterized protein n=1 Tax=Suillus discolor TaxID=1912936 RepID=A0A9P7EUY1_9AGAM|nr:uncharacterized protein F5147DRAFT_658368 [Suillus discolor]KAG2089613.1 hypothetical protein F5147DRAFT_658368 [Suillus discolor]